MPLGQGGRAATLVGLSIDEVDFLAEVVVDRGVTNASLCNDLAWPLLHRQLSPAEWQVGIFRPAVGIMAKLAAGFITELPHRDRAGFQSIRYDGPGAAVALQSLAHEP